MEEIISLPTASPENSAIETLIYRWKTPIYTLCYRLTGKKDEADDLFQETWIHIMEKLNRYDSAFDFLPWAKMVCINVFRDRCRSFNRFIAVFKTYSSDEDYAYHYENAVDGTTDINPSENDATMLLLKCIGSLSPSLRLPLVLFYYEDYSYDDIADFLHIPSGTVKSRISRAKAEIKKLMEAHYE